MQSISMDNDTVTETWVLDAKRVKTGEDKGPSEKHHTPTASEGTGTTEQKLDTTTLSVPLR